MNGRQIRQHANDSRFIEEQLFETQRALFATSNIKQIKFLQQKIKYLKGRMKDAER